MAKNASIHEEETAIVDEATHLLPTSSESRDAGSETSSTTPAWDAFKDFKGLPWWRQPSVYWLLGPYIIFTLAFGGVMVPKLDLILQLVCRQYFADEHSRNPDAVFQPVLLGSENPQCDIPEVQANVAKFMLVMNLFTGILSAIVAPKIGHLSDRYGRTRLMALASVGGILAEFITILVARYPDVVDYRWLLLGSVFDGMTGSFTTGSIMTQSYTSDCTPPSRRAVSMGYVHACLFTGLAFGPLLAGFFVKWTGSLLSIFYVVMGCHIGFMLFVWLVVPESLSQRKQLAAREKYEKDKELQSPVSSSWVNTLRTANPFAPLKALYPTGPGTSPALRRNLIALAINDTIILGASMSAGAVIVLYCGRTYHWDLLEKSGFVSLLSLVRVVVLMGIYPVINYFGRIRPAARRRGESGVAAVEKNSGADELDVLILRIALISDVIGSLGYVFARSSRVFVASGMMTAVGGLGSATGQAMITKHVPSERVGQLLGAIGMMHALARVLGPVLFNGVYALTVGRFNQGIFVLLASVFGFALVVSFAIRPHVVWEDEPEDERQPLNQTEEAFAVPDGQVPLDEEDQVRF
ncbi:major facilitator superfamily domain-containing protein [Fusarium oxysporum]|nr:major facilitator superfamily domain-containing protein [Fusarium oxysporum]